MMLNTLMNGVAVFLGFANFILNAAIAFVIWWRVLRPGLELQMSSEVFVRRSNDSAFKIMGLVFSALAVSYFLVALLRANDISLTAFTIMRIVSSLILFVATLLVMYVVIEGRLRYIVPSLLGALSIVSSGLYVWLSV